MAKFITQKHLLGALTFSMSCAFSMTAQAQTIYKLKICGINVTSENASDITGNWKKAGKINYNNNTKTLTLTDVNINAVEDDNCIRNEMNELNIVFKGTNTLNSVYGAGIYNDQNGKMTIQGGSVKIKVQQQAGIFTGKNSDLTILNTNIDTYGYWGISGITGMENEKLSIDNATIAAYGNWASLSAFASFTIKNCKITAPADAVWVDKTHCVCDKNNRIVKRTYVKIAPVSTRILSIDHTSENEIKAIYTINGKQTNSFQTGLNIVKFKDGTSKTIIKK